MRILISLALLGVSLVSNAQYCFTTYEDFSSVTFGGQFSVITETPQGNLLLGTDNDPYGSAGVLYFDGITVTAYNTANSELPGDVVYDYAFFGDSTWVATNMGLAGYADPAAGGWKISNTKTGLPHNVVTAILIDVNGTKWLGFDNGAIASVKGGDTTIFNAAKTRINDLVEDMSGTIWAAVEYNAQGNDQLMRFNGTSWQQADGSPSDLLNLAEDSDGMLWSTDGDYLFRIDPTDGLVSDTLVPPAYAWIPDLVLHQVRVDANDIKWISTNEGLLRYSDNVFSLIDYEVSNVVDDLNKPLFVDASGAIWYGYEYGSGFSYAGLAKLEITPGEYAATPTGDVNLCSGSALDIDAGQGYYNYIWNRTEGQRNLVVTDSGINTLAVTNVEGCYFYDTVSVSVLEPDTTQEICVVTVDENVIVIAWQRSYGKNTWYTKVWREGEALDEYILVDSIFIDDIQAAVDLEADPEVKAYKYRISVVDSCGNESPMSEEHITIHLTASKDINTDNVHLNWTTYKGQDIKSYEILRGGSEVTQDNVVATVAFGEISYTYQAVEAETGNYYYRVGAVLVDVCNPTAKKSRGGPFTRSVSNLKSAPSGTMVLDINDTTLMAAAAAGTYIGKFSFTVDDQPMDSYPVMLTEGEGDADNDKFFIRNDSLFTNTVFPMDKSIVYSIRVTPGKLADWIFEFAVNRMVGVRTVPHGGNRMLAYPNPCSGYIIVDMRDMDPGLHTIRLLDLSGKQVIQVPGIWQRRYEIDLQGLSAGSYILEVTGEQSGRKIVVIQ